MDATVKRQVSQSEDTSVFDVESSGEWSIGILNTWSYPYSWQETKQCHNAGDDSEYGEEHGYMRLSRELGSFFRMLFRPILLPSLCFRLDIDVAYPL